MYLKFFWFSVFLLALNLKDQAQEKDLVKYINPLSGTAAANTPSALKHGSLGESYANTVPSVCSPFGMTQWTPQTHATEKKCLPPYYYKEDRFSGFRGSHWISGSCTQDYGSVTLMPISGKLKTTGYEASFTHDNEHATPYLYRIYLPQYKISAAVTATPRCAMMEVTSLAADSVYLLITPNSDSGEGYIRIDQKKGEVYGYNPVHRIYQGWGNPAGFSGYFVVKIGRHFSTKGTFDRDKVFPADSGKGGQNSGAFIGFKMRKGERLQVRVGTSFSNLDGARKNLFAELSGGNFSAAVTRCKNGWQRQLAQIKVRTENKKDKAIFYTAFYHALQQPRLYNDVDGTYPQFSHSYQLAKIVSGNYYDDFSLWDIYRAEIPLFEILKPSVVNDFVQSLLLKGEQGGWLPVFPCWNSYTSEMIGDHTVSVVTSAYLKGISNTAPLHAYAIMRKNAFDQPEDIRDYMDGKGRRALTSYLKYGYIPMEDSVKYAYHTMEQVSRTLEYAYDDYALSRMAKKVNNTADAVMLTQRAFNYAHVFDASVGFVRGRMQDGGWAQTFSPDTKESYITEGTPRQYTFYVPQDVPGLAKLMGGRGKLEQALDSLFLKDQYWHGNEPGHQIPFLYNFTAANWKTQKVVRDILSGEYTDGPGGLSGNDDAGQMSAWYMFGAMGFYPVNPVSGEYLLCSPLFDRVTISLASGKSMKIVCHKSSKTALYIKAVRLNGQNYSKNYIKYDDIVNGGQLDIYLQDKPAKSWGSKLADQPCGLGADDSAK